MAAKEPPLERFDKFSQARSSADIISKLLSEAQSSTVPDGQPKVVLSERRLERLVSEAVWAGSIFEKNNKIRSEHAESMRLSNLRRTHFENWLKSRKRYFVVLSLAAVGTFFLIEGQYGNSSYVALSVLFFGASGLIFVGKL